MNITNAKLLGFNQRSEKFDGESSFALVKNITVECLSADITNEDGVSSYSLKDLQDLARKTCTPCENPPCDDVGSGTFRLNVNGIEMGDVCRLTSVSTEQGNLVKSLIYTLEFELRQRGSIEDELDLVSTNLGLDFSELAKYIEEFSEDFVFSESSSPCVKSYSHNVSVKFAAGEGCGCLDVKAEPRESTAVNLAKEFAGKLLLSDTRANFNLLETTLDDIYVDYGSNSSALISESYDRINNSASFSRSLSVEGEIDGNSATQKSRSFSYSDGIISITEEGTVKGIIGGIDTARVAADAAINASISGELQNMFALYKDMAKIPDHDCDIPSLIDDGSGKALVTRKSITSNSFLGEVRYSITVTNDPSLDNDGVRWIYTVAEDFNGTCSTYTESGSITGVDSAEEAESGEPIKYAKYQKALEKWKEIKGQIKSRISDENKVNSACLSPRPTNESITHCRYQGSIQYSRSYSDCPEFRKNDGRATELVVENSVQGGVPRKAMQPVVGNREAGQIIQVFGLTTTQYISNVRGHIKKLDPEDCLPVTFDDILQDAKQDMQPGGVYLKDAEYSFNNADNRTISMRFIWEG